MGYQIRRYKFDDVPQDGDIFVSGWASSRWWRSRGQRHLVRRVARALDATRREGAAQDDRRLQKVGVHLDVEWHARALHPWDGDLGPERQAQLFASRLLDDTATAIRRLFDALPEVDSIRILVREPAPAHETLLEGTVSRAAVGECAGCRSPAMMLKLLGVCFRLNDGRLEPLA